MCCSYQQLSFQQFKYSNITFFSFYSFPRYLRGLDHVKNFRRKKQECHIWRHAAAEHDGRMNIKFVKKVVGKFRDLLTRQQT